jgi:hypothetical protein
MEISTTQPGIRYLACWTEDDGIYSCGHPGSSASAVFACWGDHEHESVADAMKCLVPDGRSFIRACESGVSRSLNEVETACFLVALADMPWRSSVRSAQEGVGE